MNSSPHSNVDPREIARFDELASRWWDPEGEFAPLHRINPLRLQYVVERSGALADRPVLDVGCGGGILAEALAAAGARVTGIDQAAATLAAARAHLVESGHRVDYLERTAESMAAERPGTFRVVTCMELLEHVPEPESVVAACARLVEPGGDVFFSTINRTLRAWALAIVTAEYVLGLLPRGTHEYTRFIRPSELDAWCRAAGLDLQHLTGIHYHPLTASFALGPGLDVNYLAHYRRS